MAWLLPGLGSGVVEVTRAVFCAPEAPPAAGTAALTVTVTVSPTPTVPMSQVTVPAVCEQVPWVLVAEVKMSGLGTGSVTMTFLAADGPVLVTVIV